MRAPWRRAARTAVPLWLWAPLVWLGVAFTLGKPLGLDWFTYGASLVVAVALGVWIARRYELAFLERTEYGFLVRCRRRTRRPREWRERPPLSTRQRISRFIVGLVSWLVLFFALALAPPERAAEWAIGL